MKPAALPLPRKISAATPSAAQALMLTLREPIRELEAQLGKNSVEFLPSPSDRPTHPPPRPKEPSTRRKRSGHRYLGLNG